MAAEQTARVGAQIRRYREKAGLNQRELAEALPGKTDGTQVSKWERGMEPGGPAVKLLEVFRQQRAWV